MNQVSSTTTNRTASKGLSDAEIGAMKERLHEVKSARRGKAAEVDFEGECLAKIAEMSGSDRILAERLHALIKASAPALAPKTWYGMPAYARDGKVVCYFKCAQKFSTRYATFGFSDAAKLDDGALWPVEFALKELTPAAEARIIALVKQAVSG